jgi:hypothetical protein
VGRVVSPSSRPMMCVTFPVGEGLLTFVCPGGLHLPRDSISLGFAPRESSSSLEGSRVIRSGSRPLLLEEVTMANKDKGGSKSSKTAASKSLKEKREAKKAKAAGSSSSSSANWTKK